MADNNYLVTHRDYDRVAKRARAGSPGLKTEFYSSMGEFVKILKSLKEVDCLEVFAHGSPTSCGPISHYCMVNTSMAEDMTNALKGEGIVYLSGCNTGVDTWKCPIAQIVADKIDRKVAGTKGYSSFGTQFGHDIEVSCTDKWNNSGAAALDRCEERAWPDTYFFFEKREDCGGEPSPRDCDLNVLIIEDERSLEVVERWVALALQGDLMPWRIGTLAPDAIVQKKVISFLPFLVEGPYLLVGQGAGVVDVNQQLYFRVKESAKVQFTNLASQIAEISRFGRIAA